MSRGRGEGDKIWDNLKGIQRIGLAVYMKLKVYASYKRFTSTQHIATYV